MNFWNLAAAASAARFNPNRPFAKMNFSEDGKGLYLIREWAIILLGVIAAVVGLKGFILPNRFIDGGVTGVSLLVHEVTQLPLAVLIFCINSPFILMGYKQIGLRFALKTVAAITALSLLLFFIEIPTVTKDKLLTALFGGFFLGLGIGLAIRGGAVIDGTEVLAVAMSRRSSFSIADFILFINIIIFLVAAWLLNIETAMYSIITYLAASRTVDFIVNGVEEYIAVNVISEKNDIIRSVLSDRLGRGLTMFKARGGYVSNEHNMKDKEVILCIVTRLEISRVRNYIKEIDPDAFIYTYSINETIGGRIKKRPFH